MARPPTPLALRFWPKVGFGRPEACWPWRGFTDRHGYGLVLLSYPPRVMVFAHRVVWELTYGPIPEGAIVMHVCDNPSCVNPQHLRTGTQADNVRDMDVKGRRVAVGPIPERVPQAKMTRESVAEIRALYASGIRASVIARKFGIHKSTAQRIAIGLTWK